MPTVLVCLVLCVIFAQSAPVNKVPGFEEGKRYLYKYGVRIATGVTEGGVRQFSGYGVKFQVAIENHEGQLLFQISDIVNGKFNDVVENMFEELPIDYQRYDIDSTDEVFFQRLQTPFVVDVEDGVIIKTEFSSNEQIQDINVKKAIAALIQLHLHPSEDIDEENHYYIVQEGGIGGDCQTVYNIAHNPNTDALDIQVLNVTKTRLLNDCGNRPRLLTTPFQGYKCLHCQQKNFKPLNELSESTYQVKGNRNQYTIENVISNGAIVFTPFTTNGQTILSVVNQTLTLSSIESEQKIVKPSNTLVKHTLNFEFEKDFADPEADDQENSHVHVAVNKLQDEAKVDQLQALLSGISAKIKDRTLDSEIVALIVKYLRTFSLNDLKQFFEKNVKLENTENKNEILIRDVLLEILPFVGSRPAIYFMFELVEKELVDVTVSSNWFQNIPFYDQEPTKKILTAFKNIIENKVVQKYTKLVNSGWLAYGSYLDKVAKKYCITDSDCLEYIEVLIEKFNSAKTETEQAVFLRAIKNSHLNSTKKFLYRIVRSGYSNLLRQEAIWALTQLTNEDRFEFLSAMREILSNYQEDYVTRAFAFSTVLHFDPSPEFFNTILLKLYKEPSQKLASYAYNTLFAYANTTDPCLEHVSQMAKQIIHNLDEPRYDVLRDSVVKIFYSYNAEYNYGRSTSFISIPSTVSAFPRLLYLKQSINILGYNYDFVEIGYSSEGNNVFEYTLLNALQPESFSPGRSNDNEPTREYLQHVVDKLKLQDAIREEIKDYEVYAKIFNQDIFYSRAYGFEERSPFHPKITRDEDDKAHINLQKISYLDAQLVIPNEVGIPVYLNVKVPMTYSVTGTANVNLPLKNNGRHGFITKQLQEVNGEFDLNVNLDLSIKSKMYAKSLLGETFGFRLKTHVGFKYPIKGTVDYDFSTRKLAIKNIPSVEPYDLFVYESTPSTFINKIHKPIHYSNEITNKKYSFGHQYFGCGLTFNFTYDYFWNDYGSYRSFIKSFFKKSFRHENYYYLTDKWYAGTRGFIDYALINPTAKPFKLNVQFKKDETHPTSEILIVSQTELFNLYELNQSWSKVKWSLDVTTKGDFERFWNVEYRSAMHYPLKDVRITSFRLKRSALPGLSEPFEICYNGNLTLEDYIDIYSQKPSDIKLKYNGHFYFGRQCTLESPQLIFTALVEKSEEQHNINLNSTSYYKECQENTAAGYFFSGACWQVFTDLGRLSKLTLDVEKINFTESSIFLKLRSFLRHYFYENVEIESNSDNSLMENHSRIVANVSYKYPVIDVRIYRPHETVSYRNIFIPSIYPNFEPYSIVEPISVRVARTVFNYHSPTCLVSSNYFHTFDDVLYKHEIGDCFYLVFGDCLHHSINVLLRTVKEDNFTKAMRIFLRNVQVDLEPEDDDLVVKVNDEKKSLEDHAIYQHFSEDSGRLSFIISRYGKGIYISAKSYAADIYFDGIFAVVEVSNFYRGRQCGLCGNFDGEKLKEFVGPDRTLYKNEMEFGKSYAVAHDCKAQ